jgi:phenylalanyl-tRNA synthetase beta chain
MEDVSFYEITNVYPKGECKEHLGIVLSGKLRNVKWMHNTTTDFYTLKGLVISLFNLLGVEPNRYTLTRVEENNKFYHPGRSAYIMVGKKKIGVLGQIHPKMEKKYDVKTVYIAELDLGEILAIKTSKARFAQIPVYPAIKRDIALVVSESVAGADLLKCIKKAGKSLVNNCEIFDIYQGEHVEKGYKSIAISITYQDVTKTMVDQEINAVHSAVLSALEKEYNAKLRQ